MMALKVAQGFWKVELDGEDALVSLHSEQDLITRIPDLLLSVPVADG